MSQATAFLLAAGFGTRLRPLTHHRPKPLMPMCGVPMLDHALAHVRAHGHHNVLVNAHYLWRQVAAWAADLDGVEIQVELPEILGTGGGLKAALPRLAERVVIVNADVLSDVDLTALANAVEQGGAAMALRPSADAADIGPVEANEAGKVARITSVVPAPEGQAVIAGTHFTGVHAMCREAIDLIPEDGLQCVVRTAYKTLVPAGRVASTMHRGAWFDVGTPEAYLQANLDALTGKLVLPVDPWSVGKKGAGGCWVGPAAQIDGQTDASIIGDGAHIPANASLHECVVWDGVKVPAGEHHRCIFFGDGQLLAIKG